LSFVMRAARPDDLAALYQMAKGTGGGFTNLPADRATLKAKLERVATSFARDADTPDDDLFLFILEDAVSGQAKGTCQIFARIGSTLPFYSYRISTMTQVSQELGRTFRAELLTLSTDLDGSSEVGGLWLHPQERSAGAGALLARGRYLFMKMHRARFADRTIAELRGAHDDTGGSPFWDALAGRFFGMSFREADEFNAMHGNQFIADLMPKHPIYTAMLPESALAVIGKPHKTGLPAMRMLEKEGFAYQGYIDIFDGGPTMAAPTDGIATVAQAQAAPLTGIAPAGDGVSSLVATGRLADFRTCYGEVSGSAGGVMLDEAAAGMLGVSPGDAVTHVPR
jgi:arginine N-succinyltransferase